MWPDLQEQIDVQREMLRHLLAVHDPLMKKCFVGKPDGIEISALATMLHGFYNGVENIFKRVVIEMEEELPQGEDWHTALLQHMTVPGPSRPAVISEALAGKLDRYLKFRHFFRHAYSFQFRWDLMEPLVTGCSQVVDQFERELDAFVLSMEKRQ